MKKLKLIPLILIIIFTISACSEEEVDLQSPDIVLNSPTDHQYFNPGDIIPLDVEFSDNIGLRQFRIDIHYGEGHDHKSLSEEVEWSFDFIGDLSGTNQHIQMNIPIPENAKHGEYDMLIFCTDQSGNESWIFIEIEIEDDDH